MASTWRCPVCGAEREVLHDPLGLLAQTPRRLAYLLRGLSPQQLARRPAEGEWSIQEVVCHLADAEVVQGFRYRKAMTEEGPEVPPYDQERFAAGLAYLRRNLPAVQQAYRALRRANVDLLRAVEPRQLESPIRHPEYGLVTVHQMAQHVVHHDEAHLRQIMTVKRAIGARRR